MGINLRMTISITLVYSPSARQVTEHLLKVEVGTTASQVISHTGILNDMSDSLLQSLELGIWGKKVASHYVLQNGDRIELYRPLTVDPKVARRERFAKQGARTAGLFAKRRVGAKPGY